MQEIHILSLGAGVQSTMLYLRACNHHRSIPHIDYAIFADTGEEPEAVYNHLKWLQSLNGPQIIICTAGRIGDDLANGWPGKTPEIRRGFAGIPAHMEHGGILPRHCSQRYKINPVTNCIRRDILGLKFRQRMPVNDIHIHQYMGLSFDEPRRVKRVHARYEKIKWATVHCPLAEAKMTREKIKKWLSSRVPHTVPRSSCTCCPYHSNEEWRIVQANKSDWSRACEVDGILRDKHSICNRGLTDAAYVHKSRVPLRDANIWI